MKIKTLLIVLISIMLILVTLFILLLNSPKEEKEIKNPIVVIVLGKNYNEIKENLLIWQETVEKETNQTVILKVYSEDISADEIKTEIKSLEEKYNVAGIIFFGHIPYYLAGQNCNEITSLTSPCINYYYDSNTNVVSLDPDANPLKFLENLMPTDAIYADLDDHCSKKTYYEKEVYYMDSCNLIQKNSPFWIARITPPTEDIKEENQLINDYLKKNYEYRTGKKETLDRVLMYIPISYQISNQEITDVVGILKNKFINLLYQETPINSKEEINEEGVNEYKCDLDLSSFNEIDDSKSWMYKNNQLTLLLPCEEDNSDKRFLEEISKPYEYVIYNGHGSPTEMQLEMTKENFSKENKAIMYNMFSCTLGRFNEESYMAGEILFNTEALIVKAAQMPIVGYLADFQTEEIYLLKRGNMSIGGIQKFSNENMFSREIFGDPTLKLKQTGGNIKNPEVEISNKLINFGKIDSSSLETIKKNITIKNTGTEELEIKMLNSAYYFHSIDGKSYLIRLTENNILISPGKSKILTFELENEDYIGESLGQILLITNNPQNAAIILDYKLDILN